MHADKPLFWHQGLFLQPQHFQLADMHQLHRTRAFLKHSHPYLRGVGNLGIRTGALENRTFEINELDLLFDSGHHVTFPGNATLPPRSFEKDWVDGEKPFTVYLGLRKWNDEGGNTTLTDDPESSRINTMFAASPDPQEAPDFLGNGPAAQIKPMVYALRLFWETELSELGAYELMPIARLVRNGERIGLDRSFIPPAVTMAASVELKDILKDICDQMTSRCRRLEEYKNPGGPGSDDLDFTSTVFLLALRTLNRYTPLLKHLNDTPHVHPWQVYGVLRQSIGELSSFSREISALGEGPNGEKLLPDYDHEALGPCFLAARTLISRVLDSLTAGPEVMVGFVYDDPYHTAELPAEAFVDGHSFWLIVRTEHREQARDGILNTAKLSATGGMSGLLARAVHGIPLTYVDTPLPGLPRSGEAVCFRIDTNSPLWDEIKRTQSVSLYWDSAPKDMKAYIAALRG